MSLMDRPVDSEIHETFGSDIWQGLDRLAFCENAILLDLKDRSQGLLNTGRAGKKADDELEGIAAEFVRAFLDDIALLASGPGGKDNVAAACLEWNADGPDLLLRIARNEGFDASSCARLQEVLDTVRLSQCTYFQ